MYFLYMQTTTVHHLAQKFMRQFYAAPKLGGSHAVI
jgi:hypothetical protein